MRRHASAPTAHATLARPDSLRAPALSDVLQAHRLLTSEDADRPALARAGAIEAALDRAAWGPFPERGDLAARAALILRGIAQDHPFTNGNKRAAFAASEIFLQMNGWTLDATPDDVVAFTLAVAQGAHDLEEIAAWFRERREKD